VLTARTYIALQRSSIARTVSSSALAWVGERGVISRWSILGGLTAEAGLRGMRPSRTAALRAEYRVTWM
jgi:hypothetical protein